MPAFGYRVPERASRAARGATRPSLASFRGRNAVAACAIVAATLVAGPGGGRIEAQAGKPPASASPATPTLVDVKTINDLKALFNKDAGRSRLVLLLSPT